MVRYTKGRVQDPTNCIVGSFAGREGLMTAFVGDNPKTGSYQASTKVVECPCNKAGDFVKSWMGKLNVVGIDLWDVRGRGPEEQAK